MISANKKGEIVNALHREKILLGSMNAVARKLGISPATISNNLLKRENWGNVAESKWSEIAANLGIVLTERTWAIVPTSNYQVMFHAMATAQYEALFIAISEKAGSGKTASLTDYVKKSDDGSVYAIQCEEWGRLSFLTALCNKLGISTGRYERGEHLTDKIVRFFKQRAGQCAPLLILDEADKLKPAALRFLILLYNRLEGEIGVIVCGTENLEKEIKSGVRRNEKGYDEIDSRFGRSFIHLVGTTRKDAKLICMANGVEDENEADRIFTSCDPYRKMVGGKYVEMIDDTRQLERKIKAALLKIKKAS